MSVSSAIEGNLNYWQERLEKELEVRLGNRDGSHDLAHCRRVWKTAERIAIQVKEPVDQLVLLAAAYLHDLVSEEKSSAARMTSSLRAAKAACEVLSQNQFPGDRLQAVAHAIEAHSFSAHVRPISIEAKILQDADRIDALGAIGIARLFYTAGRLQQRLFHDTDPNARQRQLDDQTFAVDHFHLKISRLDATMNTAPGRSIARERTEFSKNFIDALLSEVGLG